jgi:transposase
VIIALAVTRDGMPVRSWILPGDTADVSTVARIKDDLRAWRLGRCVFVGDAGMYSAENLAALSRGLGRYILAVPMPQGEGDRSRGADPSGPLQAGCR